MPRPSRLHPPNRDLVALADRALPWPAAARVQLHLLRCDRCRVRAEALAGDRDAVRHQLRHLEVATDTSAAWTRLAAPDPARPRWARPALASAAVAVLALGGALWWRTHQQPQAFLSALETLPSRPDLLDAPAARGRRADAAFITRLLALTETGQAERVRDTCCSDHDGEGPDDDGLFAATLPAAGMALHVMYDDADGTRSLSTGDLVRSVARSPLSVRSGDLPSPAVPLAMTSTR